MILYYLLSTFYVLVCLHAAAGHPAAAGQGATWRRRSAAAAASRRSARAPARRVLSKATAVLAVLFMVGALALAIMGQRWSGSLLSGTPAEASHSGDCAQHAASNTSGGAESAAEVVSCGNSSTPYRLAVLSARRYEYLPAEVVPPEPPIVRQNSGSFRAMPDSQFSGVVGTWEWDSPTRQLTWSPEFEAFFRI